MRLRLIVIGLTASTTIACAARPHATLTPPSGAAPPAERLQAFERYRPAATSSTVLIQSGTAVEQTTDFLVLADGTRVYHAEDLAGAVFPDSATARAAERSRERRGHARVWSGIGWATFGVGLAISMIAVQTADVDDGFESVQTPFLLGIGLTGVGTGLWFAATPARRDAHDEKVSAFTTYEADLRTRLDVCVKDTEVVDCRVAREQGTPAPAAPAPAAPAAPAPAAPAAPAPPAPAAPAPAAPAPPAPAAPAPAAPVAPAPSAPVAPAPTAVPSDPASR
jgi:hypothetical protein